MADSRRLLLELIDDLLVVAREAASETRSIGRLVACLCRLDFGKAQSAAVYLVERNFSGHAYRLPQDVERLRQKAIDAFPGPFVADPTPDDRKQERRCLGSLHSGATRLLQFLNELRSLVDADDVDDADAAQFDTHAQVRRGRVVSPETIEGRQLVVKRWKAFCGECSKRGRRATWKAFAEWAVEQFEDMPTDCPNELRKMHKAHCEFIRPKK